MRCFMDSTITDITDSRVGVPENCPNCGRPSVPARHNNIPARLASEVQVQIDGKWITHSSVVTPLEGNLRKGEV